MVWRGICKRRAYATHTSAYRGATSLLHNTDRPLVSLATVQPLRRHCWTPPSERSTCSWGRRWDENPVRRAHHAQNMCCSPTACSIIAACPTVPTSPGNQHPSHSRADYPTVECFKADRQSRSTRIDDPTNEFAEPAVLQSITSNSATPLPTEEVESAMETCRYCALESSLHTELPAPLRAPCLSTS